MYGAKFEELLTEIGAGKYNTEFINPVQDKFGKRRRIRLRYAPSFISDVRARKPADFVQEFSKFEKAARVHGYKGYSAGRQNGIIHIKPSDSCLLSDLNRLLEEQREYLTEQHTNFNTLQPVKIVAHVPNGNRLVGVMDKTLHDSFNYVFILGISNYDGYVR